MEHGSSFIAWFIMYCLVSFYGLKKDMVGLLLGMGRGGRGSFMYSFQPYQFFVVFLFDFFWGEGFLFLLRLNILH